jgi:DHA2 family multidrug resistance protein-like MFS transporter
LQLVLGLSPLQAGLWSVPGAVAFIIGSNSAPKFVQHIRPAFLVAGGLAVAALCLGLLTQIGLNSLALIVFANTLMSLGFGITFTLTVDMVVSAAPPERAGAASALAETGAELGGALGIAVLGSLATAVYRSQVTANLPPNISAEMTHAVRETLGGAVAAARQLSSPLGSALLDAANNAFVSGLQVISLIGAVIMIGLAALTVTMLRHVEIIGEEENLDLNLESDGLMAAAVAQQVGLIE